MPGFASATPGKCDRLWTPLNLLLILYGSNGLLVFRRNIATVCAMKPHMNRREFIQASALAAAAAALPLFTSSCATSSRSKRPDPSARINLGIIGFGTIAHDTIMNFLGDPRVQVVAVADPVSELGNYGYAGELRGGRLVGQQRVEEYYAGESPTGKFRGCRPYEDFRTMLEREDLDAVYIATPDHWHCAMAIQAAAKGLHIYSQKPLALTIEEGRRMVKTVTTSGIVWQTGSQQRSSAFFRTACEYVRNGRLGKLQKITVGLAGGRSDWSRLASRNQPETPPPELNYDLWLGPAPERPYVPALLQLNWRHNWDFSGGTITDWGAHHLDIVQWALGQDATGPVAIENIDAHLPLQSDVYNTPEHYEFDAVYADGTRVNVSDAHPNGILFEGENGKSIFVSRGKLQFTPDAMRQEKIRAEETHLYVSNVHERNFVDCIYNREPTAAPIEASHRAITISHLANIAIRLGREEIKWDPRTERVVNDERANTMLSRPMRKPYAV
jgi:predicted dehydrogenase